MIMKIEQYANEIIIVMNKIFIENQIEKLQKKMLEVNEDEKANNMKILAMN